jgi:glycosyl transferase family 92
MKAGTRQQWARFLEHAALARAKPTFDIEERDWKLSMADRLRGALRVASDGEDWLSPLDAAFHSGDYFDFLTWRRAWDWFADWGAADPEASRHALTAFLDADSEAAARFRAFARILEESEARGTISIEANAALRIGAVFNFALEPLSLPMMRPGLFTKLEQILSYQRSRSSAIADVYAEHLAFARWVHARMESSGFSVRDMIDVQSLIQIAAQESDFWSGERLHQIGVPPPRPRPESAEAEPLESRRAYLSICAVYRNEAPYLREWIEFHRLVGVEHFYLYDNQSTDAHLEELAPYVEEGIITLHSWEPVPPHQPDVYNDFLSRHREDSRWVAFLDLDEFLFSPAGRSLPELLVEFEGWPGVGVNWAQFGRSGHVTKPRGLVIENYLMRVDSLRNRFTKQIVDPARVDHCHGAHHFVFHSLLAVDENHYPIHGSHTKSASFSRLRVNHYVTKSDEEARTKLGRPEEWKHSLAWRSTRLEERFPQEEDRTITSYIPALRAALERS